MKKIFYIASFLCFGLVSLSVNAQVTLDSVVVTNPINCAGDFADVETYITQTNPSTVIQLKAFKFTGFAYLPYLSSSQTSGTNVILNGFEANDYVMLMVDSVQFITNYPGPPGSGLSQLFFTTSDFATALADTASVLDSANFTVLGKTQLNALTNTFMTNLCFGDCDASEIISVSGGTLPYSLNGLTFTGLDTTLLNLCSGNYSVVVSDANGCSTNTSPTNFLISDPSQLNMSAIINSNYNGQDVSCFGDSDGEILASATGGTPSYTYSIDGSNYSSSPMFSGLSSGLYTVYYLDNNNCSSSENITLSDPAVLSGSLSLTQSVSCFGICDAEINFTVDNTQTGTAPYTYTIDGGLNFQNSSIFSSLCGNANYDVAVYDVNNCSYSQNINVSEPASITFGNSTSNFNGYEISCNGNSDGEIILFSILGGTPNYAYSIDGGLNYSSNTIFSGLSEGSYTVVVIDASGCTADSLITLDAPLPFTLSSVETSNISCFESCDGGIIAVAGNGVGIISYDLTGFLTQTSSVFNGLCGDITYGSYILDATDENSCSATTNVSLSEPLDFTYSVDSFANFCGTSTGEASITVNQGGTQPYFYLWDDINNQTSPTATGLDAGTFTVAVTDNNGCLLGTEDIIVNDQDMTLSFTTTPPCNNGGDGSATVIPNGNPGYSVLWSNGQTSFTATGLNPGFYTVQVTDIYCTVTDSIEVPQSSIVDISLDTITSDLLVDCYGYPSSGVTVNTTGGTGANTYMYYIPNISPTPQASNVFTGLFAGSYPIYTYDGNGCSDSVMVTISEPDELTFSTYSSDVSCFQGNDGSAYVDNVDGGQSPYTFSWSNGASNSYVSSLLAGDYYITVLDDNGCTSNPASILVTINEPTELTTSTNVLSNSNCAGSQAIASGEIEVLVSGATPSYSFIWSNGSTSPIISSLLPGIYTVNVSDVNGCVVTDTAEILSGSNPELNVIVQNVSCFGANDGMMFTSANFGTPPYNFSADGGNTFVPSGTPFGPGGEAFYFITVVDSIGCIDNDSVFVYEPELLEILNIDIQNISCNGNIDGELTVIHSGGNPNITYSWNDVNSQTTSTAVGLAIGSYNVIITDSAGCADTSGFVSISQPDSLIITSISSTDANCFGANDGSVSVVVDGGTLDYSYNWSFGGINQTELAVSAGSYNVIVSDSNGCTNTANISVDQPLQIIATYSRDSVSCLNGSDGSATVFVSGGFGPYSYLWDNGSTLSFADNLSSGYHNLIITDANLCQVLDSVEILSPLFDIAIDSLIINDVSCYGANNGSLEIVASGGNYPYLYSNTNGFNMQSLNSFVSLSPQSYVIYVEDNKGCFDRDTIHLTQPDSLYIDTTIFSNIQCFGDANGSIDAINALGGTGAYTYSINGGFQYSNTSYFNGFSAGILTVEVFDANNCVGQDIVIINEPSELFVDITVSDWNNYQIRCNEDSSGFANFIISGGVAPYLKSCISNNDTLVSSYVSSVTNLSAGIYDFVVQDGYGCIYEESISFLEPAPIEHNFIATHITCNGLDNASLIDSVYGGVGSANTYSYLWDTGETTYSLINLSVGTYSITVTDENNCVSDSSFIINNNNALNASVDMNITSEVSCFDFCDGEIGLFVSGGIPNLSSSGSAEYNYQWNDTLLQTSLQAIGLCVDNSSNITEYTCIVFDAQGCSDTVSYALSQPEKLIVTASILEEVLCNAGDNGKINANVTGGNGGNEFYWNNSSNWNNSSLNNDLFSGSYVVVARDDKGCLDTTEIFLEQPTELAISITEQDISCYGSDDGEITVNTSGGTPNPGIPPTYNYLWSPGGQITQTATGLSPNIYSVTVSDNNGCLIVSESVNISAPTNPLVINVDSIDETCALNDGEASVTVLGGTLPYNYNWSNGANTYSINGLTPGSYSVEILDDNGCQVSSSTIVNGVSNVFLPGNLNILNESICLGEVLSINIEEKPGLTYFWLDGLTQSDREVSPQSSTIYTLEITDPNCSNPYLVDAIIDVNDVKTMISSNISTNGTNPTITLGQEVQLYSENNYCDTWQWSWDDQINNNQSFYDDPIVSTWYTLNVDSAGCQGIDSIYIVVGVLPYDAITPNGDGMNDTWDILDINSYPDANVKVFNRWGEVVHECSGGSNYIAWDGTFKGDLLAVGTYYYVIDLNNGDEPQTGPITILR